MKARLDVMLLDEKGRVIAIHAGVTLSAAIALGEGFLRARSTDGGRVTIDGNDVTVVPATVKKFNLKPGKYVLVFKHPGKPNVKKSVTIKSGESTKLDFALE